MPTNTWDPAHKDALLTLSGGNLTATSSAGSGTVNSGTYATQAISPTVKQYFEVTFSSSASAQYYSVGVMNGSAALNANIGATNGTAFVNKYGGVNSSLYLNGSSQGPGLTPQLANGQVMRVAVDRAANKIWWAINNNTWTGTSVWMGSGVAGDDPATGTGGLNIAAITGTIYPAISSAWTGDVATFNGGTAAFAYAVPSGFVGIDTPVINNVINTQTAIMEWGSPTPLAQVTQVAIMEWGSGAVAQVTQIALEEWIAPAPIAQVTQIAIEEWTSVAIAPAVGNTYPIAGTIAGQSALTQVTTTRSYVIATPTVLTELGVAPPVGPSPQTLTDTAAATESYSLGYVRVLADTTVSSDSLSLVLYLADFVSSIDVVNLNYPQSLSDTTASRDVIAIPIPLSDSTISFTDVYGVITDFFPEIDDFAWSFDNYSGILNAGDIPECGPIAVFPVLPTGYPVKVNIVLDTIVGTTKSLREMRVPQQTYPVWDIEIEFDELRDQTQNQVPFPPFAGLYSDYQNLVQTWLMMYGQTNVFAIDLPWDHSRTDQYLGTGDGTKVDFVAIRDWASGQYGTAQPVGMIDRIQNIKFNGTIQGSNTYSNTRSLVTFVDPPHPNVVITMTFTYFYICRFTEDEQDFEEFSKNRWRVPSLKFRAVYWPGCQ